LIEELASNQGTWTQPYIILSTTDERSITTQLFF
jgi:hypothetical protein